MKCWRGCAWLIARAGRLIVGGEGPSLLAAVATKPASFQYNRYLRTGSEEG